MPDRRIEPGRVHSVRLRAARQRQRRLSRRVGDWRVRSCGAGPIEIVARRNTDGLIAFKWNGSAYVKMWATAGDPISSEQAWDGPSLHDLDNDGYPEVLLRGDVYDGRTGARIYNDTIFDSP